MVRDTERIRSGAQQRGTPDHRAERSPTGPPMISSAALFAGGRELVIRHGEDEYRLRITGNNKLILTK
jgi:hemin uptake protein HemP